MPRPHFSSNQKSQRGHHLPLRSQHHSASYKPVREWHILDNLLIAFIFVLACAANFTISLYLVPFLVVLESSFLFLVLVIMIGVTAGILFTSLVDEIEHLNEGHHVAFAIIIPLVSIINMYFVAMASNRMIDQLGMGKLHHNALGIAFVYTASFIWPYLFGMHVWKSRKSQKTKKNS